MLNFPSYVKIRSYIYNIGPNYFTNFVRYFVQFYRSVLLHLHFANIQKKRKLQPVNEYCKSCGGRVTHPAKVEDLGDGFGDEQDFRPVTTYD